MEYGKIWIPVDHLINFFNSELITVLFIKNSEGHMSPGWVHVVKIGTTN
jgi:hypothetical protein